MRVHLTEDLGLLGDNQVNIDDVHPTMAPGETVPSNGPSRWWAVTLFESGQKSLEP